MIKLLQQTTVPQIIRKKRKLDLNLNQTKEKIPKDKILNQGNFSKLLEWLDRDIDAAGQKYETIRLRLIKIFYARGCRLAEELADETIDRVIGQIESIATTYQGNPSLYFYGVAKKVFLEDTRKPVFSELNEKLPLYSADTYELERNDRCLNKCLNNLDSEQRNFIISYYQNDKQAKIEHRRQMHIDLGISAESFRLRAFRIRNKLEKCVFKCLEKNQFETF